MPSTNLEPKIFACSQSVELAEKIAKNYGVTLGHVVVTRFSDGEFQPAFTESVRGRRIFVVGSTFPNSEDFIDII